MNPFTRTGHILAIRKLDAMEQQGIAKATLRNDYIDANTIGVDLDAPLYRIMSIDRLYDLLNNHHLGMVHPHVWDDPYEVFLMRSYGITSQGQGVGFEPIVNSLYGLCFTLKEECDGLWRSFSASSCTQCSFCDWYKKHGKHPLTVKIKTTGRKLMDAFYNFNDPFHATSYWIGKVDYLNAPQIQSIVNNGIDNVKDDTAVNLIKTLLVKRIPFAYEEEVRLLYFMSSSTPNSQLNTPNLYSFDVNPNLLIDEIEFSPWVDEKDVHFHTGKITKNFKGNITRSKLYDEPGIRIKVY